MADVLLAEMRGARGFSRIVTIKRIREMHRQDKDFVSMFVDEANLLTRIRHPNVVSVLDLQEEADSLYMVMEYVDGCDFSQLLQRLQAGQQKLPVHLAIYVNWSLLRGLAQAHGATSPTGEPLHLIHRDVSPDNVLLGSDGCVKLSDFGIAKAVGRLTRTAAGVVKGKIRYMAPEMLQFSSLDQRCDVWSAGVLLWETLTTRRLFKGATDVDTIRNIVGFEVPRPSELNPAVPALLDEVVLRALQRDPAARYQSALELEQAVFGAMGGRNPDLLARDLASLMRALECIRPVGLDGEERTVVTSTGGAPAVDDYFAGMFTNSGKHVTGAVPLTQLTGEPAPDPDPFFDLDVKKR